MALKTHHLLSGLEGDTQQMGIGARHGCVSRKSHAQSFRHGRHGVGGPHYGTGPGAHASPVFDTAKFSRPDLAGFEIGKVNGCNIQRFQNFPFMPVKLHVSTGHKHGREIQSGRRHEMGRDDIITNRYADQPIK